MATPVWKGKHYAFFQNKECEFFPCHKGIKEEDFNCLFCYCPLYMLGKKCGGNYEYTKEGIKNCENCIRPHVRNHYGSIVEEYARICEYMKDNESDV
ncbi:MAG: cysteine-rich small domain-containing protein [Lachnospiraceae bacterium]